MIGRFCIKLSKSESNAGLCIDFYRFVVVFQPQAVSNPSNRGKEYSCVFVVAVVQNRRAGLSSRAADQLNG